MRRGQSALCAPSLTSSDALLNGSFEFAKVRPTTLKRPSASASGLFDRVSERPWVFPNANIPSDDSNQRRRFAKQLCCCEMQRIEGANRFDGKRPTHAREDRVRHSNQVAATLKSTKCAYRRSFFVGRQPGSRSCAKDGPRGLGDRQCGRDSASSSPDRLQRICVMLQQRGD